MGYFSNGSMGDSYHSAVCQHCVHEKDCTVWDLHMLHNYKECNNQDSMLHALIPRSDDHLHNLQCTMFYPAEVPMCRAKVGEMSLRWRKKGISRFNGDDPSVCGNPGKFMVNGVPLCGLHKRQERS